MARIGANSVLPAQRSAEQLHTADGLSLVAELALPVSAPPKATLVCLHPLPTHGGMMDSHVFRKAADRLPALADIAVLRFNTRGTVSQQGRSQGEFTSGDLERFDVAAAIEFAEFSDLPNIWLVGWSFGTDLALMHGLDPAITGAILLSPPLRFSKPDDLTRWEVAKKPILALIPEHDDYLPPASARQRFGSWPELSLKPISGAGHLWVGDAERVLDEIVAQVAPEVPTPLPREWDGAISAADTSFYSAANQARMKDEN